jgi:hypothetical protein
MPLDKPGHRQRAQRQHRLALQQRPVQHRAHRTAQGRRQHARSADRKLMARHGRGAHPQGDGHAHDRNRNARGQGYVEALAAEAGGDRHRHQREGGEQQRAQPCVHMRKAEIEQGPVHTTAPGREGPPKRANQGAARRPH